MRNLIVIGVLLTLLGIAGLIFGGVTWTETETVAEIGSLKLTGDEEKGFSVPPLASAVCIGVGVIFVAMGALRK